LAAQSRNRPRRGLAWFIVVVLSGLIALCARAAASPISDEPTSLDVLELDPLAGLDVSRTLSAAELEAITPTLARDELDDAEHASDGAELVPSPRPSRWGRIDLSLTWRRGLTIPRTNEPRIDDQIWLVATWRR